jgi:NAD(P)-dependent dehydrogenase (short-subunit alcohol dehydrogenase family)
VRIENRTFIVTGGASGLGRATAERLVALDARVVIADLNAEAGTDVADGLGPNARFVRTDVSSEQDVRAAVQTALDEHGGLHGVVNAAGVVLAEKVVGREGPHDLDAFTRVLRVNLIGTFNTIRIAASAMSAMPTTESGERGVIVCTASVSAFDGQIGQAAYSASKSGVVGMTLPIARELARYGIRVMTIAPGIFDTPLLAELSEPTRQSLGQQVPFPSRLGRPAEFAALVEHIVQNEMLNGEVIRLDGALRMAPR